MARFAGSVHGVVVQITTNVSQPSGTLAAMSSGSWVKGYFTTRDDRREEIESFWRAVDPSVPVIVAGDFNEGADGRAVSFLGDKGMRSALAEVEPRANTWHWPLRVGELTSMLDHIVYDGRLALLHAEVREVGASDHYPVFADFTLASTD